MDDMIPSSVRRWWLCHVITPEEKDDRKNEYKVEMEWLIFSPLTGVAAKLFRKSPTCFGPSPSPSPLVSSLAAQGGPQAVSEAWSSAYFGLAWIQGCQGRRGGG